MNEFGIREDVRQALVESEFLQHNGAYFLVDGQYGSTGKGLAAAVLAEALNERVGRVTTNAGPNSGHTSYCPINGEKIVLCQLPTFGVIAKRLGNNHLAIDMNAGAIIDVDRVSMEERTWLGWNGVLGFGDLFIHPNAAVVNEKAREAESDLKSGIGSTGKGTGAALANKIMRDEFAVYNAAETDESPLSAYVPTGLLDVPTLVEVSQGFSLGINEGFYPFTTSRGCDVATAMADAQIHPMSYQSCMMVVRTFPIRVGGNSGGCYADQSELSWDHFDVEPETTTVTGKQRRIFSWSKLQFKAALVRNRPDLLFVNFMNYLPYAEGDDATEAWLANNVMEPYFDVMGRYPKLVLGGYGPYNSDVRVLYAGE